MFCKSTYHHPLKTASRPRVILGIDPGSQRIGYGAIACFRGGEATFLDAGIMKISKKNRIAALGEIKTGLEALLKKHKPFLVAVERLFFSRNQKTGMEVAEARGVILLTVHQSGALIREYAPNEVKLGIAGYGLAHKDAVARMVRAFLKAPSLKLIDDASDALALALYASKMER